MHADHTPLSPRHRHHATDTDTDTDTVIDTVTVTVTVTTSKKARPASRAFRRQFCRAGLHRPDSDQEPVLRLK